MIFIVMLKKLEDGFSLSYFGAYRELYSLYTIIIITFQSKIYRFRSYFSTDLLILLRNKSSYILFILIIEIFLYFFTHYAILNYTYMFFHLFAVSSLSLGLHCIH